VACFNNLYKVALRVAVCCSVLQCVAVCSKVLLNHYPPTNRACFCHLYKVTLRVAVCCSVLQCVAVCCSVFTSHHPPTDSACFNVFAARINFCSSKR